MNDDARTPPPLGPRHWPAWLGIGLAALLARLPWSLQRVLGRGIGRLLIEHVYAQAQTAGSSRVHWLTQETNYPGRQLYDRIAERSGFIQYRKQF